MQRDHLRRVVRAGEVQWKVGDNGGGVTRGNLPSNGSRESALFLLSLWRSASSLAIPRSRAHKPESSTKYPAVVFVFVFVFVFGFPSSGWKTIETCTGSYDCLERDERKQDGIGVVAIIFYRGTLTAGCVKVRRTGLFRRSREGLTLSNRGLQKYPRIFKNSSPMPFV